MAKSVAEVQFQAIAKTSEIWKLVSSIIMTIVDEAYFEAGSKGLTLRSMDPSHIALIDLSWPSSAFEKYDCPSTIKFGLRISDFAKIIKRSNSNDSVEIGLKDSSLTIRTAGGYVRTYKMNLLASGNENVSPVPKLTFDSKFVLGASVLDRIFIDIQVISENISIETTVGKKSVTFGGTNDSSNCTVILDDKSRTEENKLQEVTVKENSKSTYNMDYISKILKIISSASDILTLEYSSKKPIRLEFGLLNAVWVQFFLAPRVDR
jgi:proliferating cell nuclear antigen